MVHQVHLCLTCLPTNGKALRFFNMYNLILCSEKITCATLFLCFTQVLALVGFRKMMDYVPSVFSQQDLLWLDNLMPDSGKHKKKKKGATDESGAEANNSKGVRERKI